MPTRLAVAINPRATKPPETDARNIVARPVDSAMVDARAPWRVKCSVVANVTAAGRGSLLLSFGMRRSFHVWDEALHDPRLIPLRSLAALFDQSQSAHAIAGCGSSTMVGATAAEPRS